MWVSYSTYLSRGTLFTLVCIYYHTLAHSLRIAVYCSAFPRNVLACQLISVPSACHDLGVTDLMLIALNLCLYPRPAP